MIRLRLVFIICISILFGCNNRGTQPEIEVEVSNTSVERVEPPNWWVGFKNPKLQLLIKEDNISTFTPSISYPGITITKINQADSPNYIFLDIEISESTPAGKFDIVFIHKNRQKKTHTYELKSRLKSSEDYIGFNSSDAIYLITPDRFANGNPQNDIIDDLNEVEIDRSDNYKRHGGDIKGIINNLDYISEMGFTAIWSSPLLINDMSNGSYHGYAMTDYYKVDPRFGTLDEYKNLSVKAKEKGIKLIMDQVANHCGLEHWWIKDLPFKDWLNHQDLYKNNRINWNWNTAKFSNHKRTTNQDIYASNTDKIEMTNGWFVPEMPDLNQRNPYMANYIIQNSIWWIETLDLGGIRQDTYPYPDKDFMSRWAGAIMQEYPNFNIVGEEWSYNPLLISYWQKGTNNNDGYTSNLKSTMDFAMQSLIAEGLNEDESWDKGLVKLYEGLANDFIYPSPKDIMIFPDNHDMSRIFTQLKGDIVNTKMALSYLLMLPRTPQIYYGTEILMNDFEKPGDHGLIRTDFPGGWQNDTTNAFTGKGLSNEQKDMQFYLKTILNYRKKSKAIHEGKTIHFAPENGVYVLSRSYDDETVVHIINKNDTSIDLDLSRFEELKLEGQSLKNVLSGEEFIWNDMMRLKEKGSLILTTKK